MRLLFTSFAAVVAATLAYAQPYARSARSINPDPNTIHAITDWSSIPAPDSSEANTNAKRFAAGLPPLPPRTLRRHPQRGDPHRLGTLVQAAPRAQSSPLPPQTAECNILVKKTDGAVLGYLAATFNQFGEYGPLQGSPEGALKVSYQSGSLGPMDLTAANGPSSAYPAVGAIAGFASENDDLGPGTFNYAYIGGTPQTTPGSPPVEGPNSFTAVTEMPAANMSPVWSLDPASQAMTARWMNSDGSTPATSFVYANDDNQALLITGDSNELRSEFDVDYPDVTLTCVPPPTSASVPA